MLSCFGTVFQPHSLSGHLPYWNIFTTVLECFGSQGRKSEPTNRKPPDPDPWRFQNQNPYPYPKAREKESFVWPVNIGLHLFALVSVAVHMWFYARHLRAFGFSLMEWTMNYGYIQVGVPTLQRASGFLTQVSPPVVLEPPTDSTQDRKSTRLNSSHLA